MGNPQAGADLALEFLNKCADERMNGVDLLNATANVLIGFFMSAEFPSHRDRMKELDNYCKDLRAEIDKQGRAPQTAERGKHDD